MIWLHRLCFGEWPSIFAPKTGTACGVVQENGQKAREELLILMPFELT